MQTEFLWVSGTAALCPANFSSRKNIPTTTEILIINKGAMHDPALCVTLPDRNDILHSGCLASNFPLLRPSVLHASLSMAPIFPWNATDNSKLAQPSFAQLHFTVCQKKRQKKCWTMQSSSSTCFLWWITSSSTSIGFTAMLVGSSANMCFAMQSLLKITEVGTHLWEICVGWTWLMLCQSVLACLTSSPLCTAQTGGDKMANPSINSSFQSPVMKHLFELKRASPGPRWLVTRVSVRNSY